MTPGEHNAKAALRASMAINGDKFKKEGGPMADKRIDAEQTRFPGVTVEWKVPLWGLASGGGVLLWGLVNMWFTLNSLSAQMADMQGLLKANNAATMQLASEQALLKYRLEKLEAAALASHK